MVQVGSMGSSIGRVAFLAVISAATVYLEYIIGRTHNEGDLIRGGLFIYPDNSAMIELRNAADPPVQADNRVI